MNPIQTIIRRFRELQPRQQVVLVGGFIAILVTLFILYTLINKTSWTTVATGMNPASTNTLSQSLSTAGIQNNITNGGSSIEVPSDQADKARATVATDPASAGGTVGFEIFDKNNLGATDLQQQVQYQRALEGEITRTVEQIQGVQSAQVQLVLQKDQMFTDQGTAATASVILNTSVPLTAGQVAGVARLVQGAVPGLKADAVTITNQNGNILWPNAQGSAGGAGDKNSAQTAYDQQLAMKLTTMINPTGF
jgi:flagellar M-ring protein FliF